MTCKDHAQWWDSEVVEYNRRWSSFTNLTVPLNKDGLLLLVEGAISGSVDFVEDDTLVNEAYVDFYVEFHYKTFRKTEFCTLENKHDGTTGVGIFVSASLRTVRSPPRWCWTSCSDALGFGDGFQGPKHPEKGKEIKTRITVYLPKSATPKLEKMFVVVPQMEVNFPPDFKIKPKLLAVESRKVLAHVPVSSIISLSTENKRGDTGPHNSLGSPLTDCRMRILRIQSFRWSHQRKLHRQERVDPQDPVWSHRREHHHDQ